MSKENITKALESLPIGYTGDIAGLKVTRWAADAYEIGTWGKSSMVQLLAIVEIQKKLANS